MVTLPLQGPAAKDKHQQSRKARRSSGLREILSLALELGASSGASAVPVTWDGSADTRRASRAKPLQAQASPPPAASTAKATKVEEGTTAGTTASAARSGGASKSEQQPQAAVKAKGEKVAEASSSAKKAKEAPKQVHARASEAVKAKPAAKAAQQKGSSSVIREKQENDEAAGAKKGSHAKTAKSKPPSAKVSGHCFALVIVSLSNDAPQDLCMSPLHQSSDIMSGSNMACPLPRSAENTVICNCQGAYRCRSLRLRAQRNEGRRIPQHSHPRRPSRSSLLERLSLPGARPLGRLANGACIDVG